MFIHEEIIVAMSVVQKKHDLTKTEVIAEMAMAINEMLVMIEPSLQAMSARYDLIEGGQHAC